MPKQIASGHFQDFGEDNNLDPELGSTVVFNNLPGYPTIGFSLIVPTGGKVVFEGTFDGDNWIKITFRGITTDGYFTETSTSESFIGSIVGLRKIRVRVVEAGTAPGKFKGRVQRSVSVLEGIEHSNPPHKFGHKTIRKSISSNTIQTGTIIWTPNVNKRFVVTDFTVSVSGNTEGTITIFDEVNSPENILYNTTVKPKTDPPFNTNLVSPFVSSALNNSLKVTTNSAINLKIVVFGYESE